jgi:hypothetical protein
MLVLTLAFTVPATAAEEKKKDDNFTGSFMVGYRGVDVTGVHTKYMEDYNLDSGARLFRFNLHYRPTGDLKKLVDSVDVGLYNFGGEPFESFYLSVVKYGTYQFKYDRRKSNYFYKDIFAGHDFHTFDFDRINDSLSLKVWLCKYSRFYFNFDRYTRKGNSTTSLDINRDEFEFDRPVDESSKEITLGLDVTFKGFSLLFQEKIRDYVNDYHFFLGMPGMGEDPTDAADLMYFNVNQPYDFWGLTHSAKMNFQPFSNLLINASASIGTQDMRISYTETAAGTTYFGAPFGYSYDGSGAFERKLQMYDAGLTYLVTDKLAVTVDARYRNLEQDGSMETYDVTFNQDLDYHTFGVDAGLQYQASDDIAVSAGYRTEERTVDIPHDGASHLEKTKRTGFFGNLKWNFSKDLRLTLDYQNGSYDDPYTDISLSDFNRARLTGRYKIKNFYVTGSYLYQLSENNAGDGWRAERNQLNVRAGYKNKKVKLSLGYGLNHVTQSGDRHFVFYGQPATWNIYYEGRSSLFDAYLYFLLDKKWTLGGYANWYKNDGSWEVERLILRPFLEVKFDNGFIGQLAFRYIDFKENLEGLNNYTANIFEISFGYRW